MKKSTLFNLVTAAVFLGTCVWNASAAVADKRGNVWYFGNAAGITFNSGSPVPLTDGVINTNEGVATIADASGALLFSTDGSTVYNKNNTTMTNGTGLKGNSSSTQSAIIVPLPGSSSIYYIFTVGDTSHASDGLQYSVVNLSLQSGLGEVTSKNTVVVNNTTERVTAVLHQNGRDYWIITRLAGDYRAFKLTPSGLVTTAVISAIGATQTISAGPAIGYLKAAPNGTKVVSASYGGNYIELMDFNNSTGVLSTLQTIGSLSAPYGAEFSPDNRKLYVGQFGGAIFQYNLQLSSPSAISASKTQVTAGTSGTGALQLGPDQKIYIAKSGAMIASIGSPNKLVSDGVDFNASAVDISPKSSTYGLPALLANIFLVPGPTAATVPTYCQGDTIQSLAVTGTTGTINWYSDSALTTVVHTGTSYDPGNLSVSTNFYVTETVGGVEGTATVVGVNIQAPPCTGFTVSSVSGPVTKSGGTATFTVRLKSQPTADVTVTLTSANTAGLSVSPTTLTFTSSNWDQEQTVTVTGADDGSGQNNQSLVVNFSPASSSDAAWDGVQAASVTVSNGAFTANSASALRIPVLLSPQNNAVVSVGDIHFQWISSATETGMSITYKLCYDTNADLSAAVCQTVAEPALASLENRSSLAKASRDSRPVSDDSKAPVAFAILPGAFWIAHRRGQSVPSKNPRAEQWMKLISLVLFAVSLASILFFTNGCSPKHQYTNVNATVTGLSANSTYYWQVTATDSFGNSKSSPVYSFTSGS